MAILNNLALKKFCLINFIFYIDDFVIKTGDAGIFFALKSVIKMK